MSFMNRMERRLKRFCIPHLTLVILFGQVAFFVPMAYNNANFEKVVLTGEQVLDGEVWRLVSFMFIPATTNAFFFFFACMLFFIMGNALEQTWGTFRFNLFILIGYLSSVGVAFIYPQIPTTNGYLLGSVFLAFAYLYPDFSLMLMFILPVKVRWLALVQWIFMAIAFVRGPGPIRLIVVAGVFNFLLFFGKDIIRRMNRSRRQMKQAAVKLVTPDEAFHKCTTCGVTERDDPSAEFRYCSQCDETLCYCSEHIRDHEHVVADAKSEE